MFSTPILFLIFNRPDTTEKVFEKIREIKPRQLFVAADGPREGNEKDKINCEAARSIATNVDWDCEVKTLFRDENLGCGKAVSKGITWFFDHVEMGIILEDDVLVDLSFFHFCQNLLFYYRNNDQIFHIGGSNYQNGIQRGKASYYFSKYPHIWGWATWKEKWDLYNFELTDSKEEIEAIISNYCGISREKKYWSCLFNSLKDTKEISSWSYQWLYCSWKSNGISVLPNQNLVENIGFNNNATHTFVSIVDYNKNKILALLEIQHPAKVEINNKADLYTFCNIFNKPVSLKNKVRNFAYKVVPSKIYKKLKKIYRGSS